MTRKVKIADESAIQRLRVGPACGVGSVDSSLNAPRRKSCSYPGCRQLRFQMILVPTAATGHSAQDHGRMATARPVPAPKWATARGGSRARRSGQASGRKATIICPPQPLNLVTPQLISNRMGRSVPALFHKQQQFGCVYGN